MLCGCKPDAAIQKGAVIDGGVKSGGVKRVTPSGPTGSVAGTISFAGKVPPAPAIDTTMDPACSIGGTGQLPVEQFVVKNGKLANVFVYVKSGPAAAMQAAPTSTQPVVLDQKGCQYTPHVIGVMEGGSVEFRNSDPTMHNVHTMPAESGNPPIDISEGPRGPAETRQFPAPELMLPVRCNNHPWMNAFINVSATPFFAVSDASGHFDLRGLPPGKYVLGAVHEKMGEKTMEITVQPNAATQADTSFAAK